MPEAGWFTPSMIVLPLQAIAAAASVRLFASRVAPNMHRLHAPASVVDSLAPFALALPLICGGWRTQSDAAATGWIAVGAPIVVAVLALGAALCGAVLGRDRGAFCSVSPLAALAWSAVGGMLLLLGAAHDLTVWVGQCAFALGAVLLWMNTPEISRNDASEAESEAAAGVTLVLFCAIIQSVAMLFTPARYLPIAAAIAIAHSAMIVTLAATLASSGAAIRLGGWTATYGVLLGLGAISLRHLLPQTLVFAEGERMRPPLKVAHGFGAFALEAMILLAFGVASLAIERLPARQLRVAIGVALILAAASLAGWRLQAM